LRFAELAQRIDQVALRFDKVAEIMQLNFDRLTRAMMGLPEHVADHRRRIENPERQ
jgi:hypothetical protein